MKENALGYMLLMTTSHVLTVWAGLSATFRHPNFISFWVIFAFCIPLIYTRHTTMVKEVRKGAPSGDVAMTSPDSCVLDRASEMGAVSSRADKLVLFIM